VLAPTPTTMHQCFFFFGEISIFFNKEIGIKKISSVNLTIFSFLKNFTRFPIWNKWKKTL
jgi:hypothetical protein